ncbi:hypothetical protein C8R44DRAFT_991905 [Mycena epipterygia]|nr:hypothetical protein C8R44DRAFT_991905 [Mycena epipterygia]
MPATPHHLRPAAALYFKLKEAIRATCGERGGRKGKRARHIEAKYASPLSFYLPVGVYSSPRSQSLRNSLRCTARTRRATGRAAHTVHVHRTRSQLLAQSRSLCRTRFDEMRGGDLVNLAHSSASYHFPPSLHLVFADTPNQAYLLPTSFAAVLSAGYLLGFLVHLPRPSLRSRLIPQGFHEPLSIQRH